MSAPEHVHSRRQRDERVRRADAVAMSVITRHHYAPSGPVTSSVAEEAGNDQRRAVAQAAAVHAVHRSPLRSFFLRTVDGSLPMAVFAASDIYLHFLYVCRVF